MKKLVLWLVVLSLGTVMFAGCERDKAAGRPPSSTSSPGDDSGAADEPSD